MHVLLTFLGSRSQIALVKPLDPIWAGTLVLKFPTASPLRVKGDVRVYTRAPQMLHTSPTDAIYEPHR